MTDSYTVFVGHADRDRASTKKKTVLYDEEVTGVPKRSDGSTNFCFMYSTITGDCWDCIVLRKKLLSGK